MNKKYIFLLAPISILLSSCANMPTPPSEITSSYTSGLKYTSVNCSHLGAELNSIARRENQLVLAQKSRIKSSELQVFLLGYGKGDGLEASELANVRGEKEAIRKALDTKQCEVTDAMLAMLKKPESKKEEETQEVEVSSY